MLLSTDLEKEDRFQVWEVTTYRKSKSKDGFIDEFPAGPQFGVL